MENIINFFKDININLLYVIVAAVVLIFMIGMIVGLIIAVKKMRKAMSKEQAAEAQLEIEGVLKSFIVWVENKYTAYAAWLKTQPEKQKSGGIKKDQVLKMAEEYMKEKGLNLSAELLSSMIDNLCTFMNKKTPAITAEEKKE